MFIQNLEELKDALDKCDSRKDFIHLAKNINLDSTYFQDIESWEEDHYTRNCVFRSDNYELILLCWEPGQDTPIHCHAGEECWVYMVEGEIREERFSFPRERKPQLTHDQLFAKGQVAYINDEMGVHRLSNQSGRKTMSLHLYVGPIDECRVFDVDTGEYEWKELHYDSTFEQV